MFDKLREGAREALTGSTIENDLRARLHADHLEIARLIDELMATAEHEIAMREDIRDQIVVHLTAHFQAEEEIVYHFLKTRPQTRGMAERGSREHAQIERVLDQIATSDCTDPGLTDLVISLRDLVTPHVHEEETDLLPTAERYIDFGPLAALIAPFNARKQILIADVRRILHQRASTTDPGSDAESLPSLRPGPGLEESTSQF